MIIAIVLCVNVLLMAFELQIDGSVKGYEQGIIGYVVVPSEAYPGWESAFKTVDLIFTLFFAADVILRVCVLKSKFFKAFVNYIDLAVTCKPMPLFTSGLRVTLPVSPILFRLLRIGKLSRAIRMVTMHSVLQSLHLLIKCLTASTNMLFWSFCLLTFFQCVSGLVISTLCRDFIRDTSQPLELRRSVWLYYGTFTRTFLSMFEILFANWSPPCRILVDEVSESFAVFFLIYRCLLGFAVLNVVNAVFVQQTMKTASSDEELAFKQKERDLELFTRKVKKLFRTVDESGDGLINKDEFSKLVKDPMLNFWLGQLVPALRLCQVERVWNIELSRALR
ncbi:Voltage-dependent T-type calcium channel subunit alpha-1H [Durusdinium trenchii]|uniref:Voltage-dependent T-type calcium channel subunit alpha-1H n=1 Tax=Durusdinium trenchii TaxID=1381693 RepID=A0ABP0SGH8_9DINO